MVISMTCSTAGVTVTYNSVDVANVANGTLVEKTVSVVNLLSADSLRHLVTTVVSNFTSFFALGTVFTIILGAILFMAFGRHPIAGLAAAFAGVSGGWSANLLTGTNDPVLAGMSTQATQSIDPSYTVLPVANWYFCMVSTMLLPLWERWLQTS